MPQLKSCIEQAPRWDRRAGGESNVTSFDFFQVMLFNLPTHGMWSPTNDLEPFGGDYCARGQKTAPLLFWKVVLVWQKHRV